MRRLEFDRPSGWLWAVAFAWLVSITALPALVTIALGDTWCIDELLMSLFVELGIVCAFIGVAWSSRADDLRKRPTMGNRSHVAALFGLLGLVLATPLGILQWLELPASTSFPSAGTTIVVLVGVYLLLAEPGSGCESDVEAAARRAIGRLAVGVAPMVTDCAGACSACGGTERRKICGTVAVTRMGAKDISSFYLCPCGRVETLDQRSHLYSLNRRGIVLRLQQLGC